MTGLSVAGFNNGGSLTFRFHPEPRGAAAGTVVNITVRLPLPPVIGSLIKPLLESQIRREVRPASAEDKHDLEVRGYGAWAAQPLTQPIQELIQAQAAA